MKKVMAIFLIAIVLLVFVVGSIIWFIHDSSYSWNQPMPSIWLHEVCIENGTNNLLVTLCSHVYNNLEISKITVIDLNSSNVLVASSDI